MTDGSDRPTLPDLEPPAPSWVTALLTGIDGLRDDVRKLDEKVDWVVKATRDNASGLLQTNQHFREAIDKLGQRVLTVERRDTPQPMAAVRPDGNGHGGLGDGE